MSRHEPFVFSSKTEILKKAEDLGIELPLQDSIESLFENTEVGSKEIPNRMAVQPMEGFDAELDGSPGELTFRRYNRYARGGSGLIWFEATSVVPEGHSNPRQLMITTRNLDSFKRLVEQTKSVAYQALRSSKDVFCVLQLTHSGRYSKPEGKASPQVVCFNPYLDKQPEAVQILSDSELDHLQDKYVEAAGMAHEAGFDAVDIKSCHGYLINELLAAYTRKNSSYGESFENRIRFLTEVIQKISDVVPGILIAVRLNAYDGIPYPYGFGVSQDGSLTLELFEPMELIFRLVQLGCSLFNITAGNPYNKPHFGRPFDRPLLSASVPDEHPLDGISRLLKITAELQKKFPEVPFVGTGYSWLRQFFPFVGAAVIERGEASLIGLGRSSFAYPEAPKELMDSGTMNPKKVCITCSRCSELMRHGHISGCAVHDREIYGKEYKEISSEKESAE